MAFTAADINVAYLEGVRDERKRIVALMEKYLDNDHVDLSDIWEDLRRGEGSRLKPEHKHLDIGEL